MLMGYPLQKHLTVPTPAEPTLAMEMLQSLPVTAKQIHAWTDQDLVFAQVRSMRLKGWEDSQKVAL